MFKSVTKLKTRLQMSGSITYMIYQSSNKMAKLDTGTVPYDI
jgi:hypothetical protein